MKKITVLLFVAIVGFTSCKKSDVEEVPFDCGCDSETIGTVPTNLYTAPVEEQITGKLFYKDDSKIDNLFPEERYNNRFWIWKGLGCVNCQFRYFICNEDILGNDFDYLKQSGDSVDVKFTGNLKLLCGLKIAPADFSAWNIELTYIE